MSDKLGNILEITFKDQEIIENNLDLNINNLSSQIDEIDGKIEIYDLHSDNIDYIVSVGCGVLTGLIDTFLIGGIDPEIFLSKDVVGLIHKKFNQFIENFAKNKGFKGKGIKDAIQHLEKKYKIPTDNYKGLKVSSSRLHHLEDLAHHPTLLGLAACIVSELLRLGIFIDNGRIKLVSIPTDKTEIMKMLMPFFLSGLFIWIANIIENKLENEIDKEIPKVIRNLINVLVASPLIIKILRISTNWVGHLVSDMGGSKNTAGGGMGIPGIFLSFLSELSIIPGINKPGLSKLIKDIYSKDKIDFRKETAFVVENLKFVPVIGKQLLPVMCNEIIVRSFYFIRHLAIELKGKQDFKDVDWKRVIPFGNVSVGRMLTISNLVFTTVDLSDAAIRGAIAASASNGAGFAPTFFLRINYVGVVRCTISLGNELITFFKRKKLKNKKIYLENKRISYLECKMFNNEKVMWEVEKKANESLESFLEKIDKTTKNLQLDFIEINESINEIKNVDLAKVEKKNKELILDILDVIEEE